MPITLHKILDTDTEFAVWKIEEPAELLYSKLKLDETEKAVYESLGKGKRELHWLSSRVLLRNLINTPDFIKTGLDEHHKPFLVNLPHHFSLSHSFDYAAVMISKNKKVGIDIELVKDKILKVEKKFLSAEEQEFIDPNQKVKHLYACWAAKEAVYKLYGRKGVSLQENIRLKPFKFNSQGVVQANILFNNCDADFEIHYQEFEEYMLAYVSSDKV
ncbi:4'-phosphopantetheinyl transferase family protein [Solitalea canadensis]|uniref:Phosphopantetheinyl transferase n=1 Tax=Solitalea canadensis (strain ATCC 29591 / DSM 3403 / JCM 21819 / LMG 8368 / NBRC 15130 / NCIMB 12057 / USAM 9D) TaxID=929556 RepID=H8KMK9_SOLCM|nr:4'-phosphopantetheinyl transferase superfamily protein [Solitalea canadensis]AFD09000.1 phosphopantetheinyl transferase [Solitalea canadensis DSM 3403]